MQEGGGRPAPPLRFAQHLPRKRGEETLLDEPRPPSLSFNHMVERTAQLDLVFGALSDVTRRDILRRVAKKELSVSEIASSYDLSFAAVAKHLVVLEKARLVTKRRQGKLQVAALAPAA